MKAFFYLPTLLFIGLSITISGQTPTEFLPTELAYKSRILNMIEVVPKNETALSKDSKSVPYSADEGFIYLNIPDSLIVVYCGSRTSDFRISERLRMIELLKENPIQLKMLNDNDEHVIVQMVTIPKVSVQLYFPDTRIDIGKGEQIMAFEFSDLKLLGKAK